MDFLGTVFFRSDEFIDPFMQLRPCHFISAVPVFVEAAVITTLYFILHLTNITNYLEAAKRKNNK